MIKLRDNDDILTISYQNLFNYTGSQNPVAVALIYRLFGAALEILSPDAPPDRYSFYIRSAFAGQGVQDCFEYLTRAQVQKRLDIAPEIAPKNTPSSPLGQFYFEIFLRNRGCSMALKQGYFTPEFSAMIQQFINGEHSPEQHAQFKQAKQELAERILGANTDDLFECLPIDDLPMSIRLPGAVEPHSQPQDFLQIQDGDNILKITLEDMIALHGRENIGGVALAYKALEFAFNRLSPGKPPSRADISIFSAFPGSGTLDGFETALRVATQNRLEVDSEHEKPGATLASVGLFYFRISSLENSVAFTLKAQAMPKRFMDLAMKNKLDQLNQIEKTVFQAVKEDLAITIMSHAGEALFEEI